MTSIGLTTPPALSWPPPAFSWPPIGELPPPGSQEYEKLFDRPLEVLKKLLAAPPEEERAKYRASYMASLANVIEPQWHHTPTNFRKDRQASFYQRWHAFIVELGEKPYDGNSLRLFELFKTTFKSGPETAKLEPSYEQMEALAEQLKSKEISHRLASLRESIPYREIASLYERKIGECQKELQAKQESSEGIEGQRHAKEIALLLSSHRAIWYYKTAHKGFDKVVSDTLSDIFFQVVLYIVPSNVLRSQVENREQFDSSLHEKCDDHRYYIQASVSSMSPDEAKQFLERVNASFPSS